MTINQYILQPICSAIASLMPGQIEVVIHDLNSGKIVHIENPFSMRKVGDDSLIDIGEIKEQIIDSVNIGPYYKVNSDGERTKSVTTVIRDNNGVPIALLCVNMRIGHLQQAEAILNSLTAISSAAVPAALMKKDWRERTNILLGEVLNERNISVAAAKRRDKVAILEKLDEAEIFEIRGSIDYVADCLSVSRANLYQLLSIVRSTNKSN